MINKILTTAALGIALSFAGTSLLAANSTTAPLSPEQELTKKIRRELNTLPFLGIFDYLTFQLDGRKVIVSGYATRPVLASSAINVVKGVPGVEEVVNKIEVLPLSPNDDQLRIAVYRTVFSQGSLGRYTLGALPPVRIIVKNGNVTLHGVVMNEMDKNMFTVFANQVSGVFQVTNRLQVESKS
ncbi:MAG: BON domain-containing protein [Bryobacter sp.]|nr:BON domain-containing protein [Bryobacter sp.]